MKEKFKPSIALDKIINISLFSEKEEWALFNVLKEAISFLEKKEKFVNKNKLSEFYTNYLSMLNKKMAPAMQIFMDKYKINFDENDGVMDGLKKKNYQILLDLCRQVMAIYDWNKLDNSKEVKHVSL